MTSTAAPASARSAVYEAGVNADAKMTSIQTTKIMGSERYV